MQTHAKGAYVAVRYGHSRVTSESLTDSGGGVWTFAQAPVSTQKLIITGTKSSVTRFLVNYTLEPMQGTLTIPGSFPAFDSVHASYFYYTNDELVLMTRNFKVPFPTHNFEQSLYGEPVYTLNHNFPTKVTFDAVLTAENQRALLTESMQLGYFFIIIDKFIDASYARRAYEGPIVSDEQASIQKGMTYLLPITLEVQQSGTWDEGGDTINCAAFL